MHQCSTYDESKFMITIPAAFIVYCYCS